MKLAYQGILKHPNIDVFCDTTGCAFTFAVARWKIPHAYLLAYVHYPTISTDMMLWEWKNTNRSKWKTIVKLVYYWMFAILYGCVGSLADLVMVNSTWTCNHVQSLWRFSKHNIHIVYPPCRVPASDDTTKSTTNTTNSKKQRQNTIVSIGQFRPEKNHPLQVESLAKVLKKYPEHKGNVKLLLIGSCRNEGDRQRVEALRSLANKLELTDDEVQFSINPPYSELQQSMQTASMGIHTMRQEHFGIGIVEMMAAGLLTIAHNSGGPKTDIVEHGETGFLATTADEYAEAIHRALTMKEDDSETMRRKAKVSATRFSDQVFEESLETVLPKLVSSTTTK
jgi:alpha-1,2-mannosyltransferase